MDKKKQKQKYPKQISSLFPAAVLVYLLINKLIRNNCLSPANKKKDYALLVS